MPCFTGHVDGSQILIDVLVTKCEDETGKTRPADSFRALVDTGAMRSCVIPKVVQIIGARPIDKKRVYTAAGPDNQNMYRVNMHIPVANESTGGNVVMKNFDRIDVFETTPSPSGRYEVLLGMDVIQHGSLHISGKHFTFCI